MSKGMHKCKSCGVPLLDHLGVMGTCAELVHSQLELDVLRARVNQLNADNDALDSRNSYLKEKVSVLTKKLKTAKEHSLHHQ